MDNNSASYNMGKKMIACSKSVFVLFLIMTCIVESWGQEQLTLRFTGKNLTYPYQKIDIVTIKNLTRQWQVNLNYPDTTLQLGVTMGLFENDDYDVVSVSPNPSQGNVKLSIDMVQSGVLDICVYDLKGSQHLRYSVIAECGSNMFLISLSKTQTYIISIKTNNYSKAVKVVNVFDGGADEITLLHINDNIASTREIISHPFQYGDLMEYQGYIADVSGSILSQKITKEQYANEDVTLTFDISTPLVVIYQISDISDNSANVTCNVLDNGGASVTERGICWSTSHNPTISEFYATSGTGTGSYTVNMTGLIANTTYYVRAYSKNIVGISYDNEVGFVTQNGGGTGDHEYVDLGLPSGNLWATCNVGANSHEEYGDYFAWGEIATKDIFNWSTYQWCYGTPNSLTKYNTDSDYGIVDNKTVLELEDDVAYINWGGSWHTPTFDEMNELLTYCTWTLTSQGCNNGYLVTGPNNNSIFLPSAGYRYGGNTIGAGFNGYYWSNSLYIEHPIGAHFMLFGFEIGMLQENRFYGMTVRPVSNSQK